MRAELPVNEWHVAEMIHGREVCPPERFDVGDHLAPWTWQDVTAWLREPRAEWEGDTSPLTYTGLVRLVNPRAAAIAPEDWEAAVQFCTQRVTEFANDTTTATSVDMATAGMTTADQLADVLLCAPDALRLEASVWSKARQRFRHTAADFAQDAHKCWPRVLARLHLIDPSLLDTLTIDWEQQRRYLDREFERDTVGHTGVLSKLADYMVINPGWATQQLTTARWEELYAEATRDKGIENRIYSLAHLAIIAHGGVVKDKHGNWRLRPRTPLIESVPIRNRILRSQLHVSRP